MKTNRFALAALTTLAALPSLTSDGCTQEVVSSYVTFYGFDDNDDGNPTHLGTGIISNATLHGFANEDLGTYETAGTLATDANFLPPRDQGLCSCTGTLLCHGRHMRRVL
jgi:hypothetical protein